MPAHAIFTKMRQEKHGLMNGLNAAPNQQLPGHAHRPKDLASVQQKTQAACDAYGTRRNLRVATALLVKTVPTYASANGSARRPTPK